MQVDGLHHITAISADIDANLAFYGQLLGLRLVWQGVNADDPDMRHIAYGDERGNPGSLLTFFDMPRVTRGRPGTGLIHRLLLRVAGEDALEFWQRRLDRAGVPSERLAERLVFSDREGLGLELVIDDGEDEPLVADAPDVDRHFAIRGLHAVRAYGADAARSTPVFSAVLGMQPEAGPSWLARGKNRHCSVTYDAVPAEQGARGAGTIHHVAFTISDGDENAWRSHIAAAGLRPTPVLDRKMTKSVYFREPNGVLLEVATDQPGFVFEDPDHLGESLVLIGDLEHRRAELERRFPLLPNPRTPTTDD